MSGFAIFNIDITNPEPYKEYIEKVKPIAEKLVMNTCIWEIQ